MKCPSCGKGNATIHESDGLWVNKVIICQDADCGKTNPIDTRTIRQEKKKEIIDADE